MIYQYPSLNCCAYFALQHVRAYSFIIGEFYEYHQRNPNSVCTSWNKSVRRILNLPHDAHAWLLGPLLKQRQQ